MSQIFILLRRSLLSYRRARAAIVITFVVPIVLIYLFGHVFGLYRKDSGPLGIPIAVVNLSKEAAAQTLVSALRAEKSLRVVADIKSPDGGRRPLTEDDVRIGLKDNEYRYALILPTDLVSPDRFGVRMRFLTNPRNDIEAQMVNGLLQKTVFSKVPQLLGQSLQTEARQFLGADRYERFTGAMARTLSEAFGGDADEIQRRLESGNLLPLPGAGADAAPSTGAGADAGDLFARLVKIETEQVAGNEVKNPMAARIVGGYAIMFLLFAVSGSSAVMFEERRSGVFQRLLASPVRPAHILWARFLFNALLGLAQISALFLAGRVLFGLDIFSHAVPLLVVAMASAAACSAFGMLVVAFAPSQEAAGGLATLVVLSMSAVGGAWFPVSFMPSYIQSLSKLTLVYWSVEGFTDVLWAGSSLGAVLPKVGILAGIAAVVMGAAVWRFNRRGMFEA